MKTEISSSVGRLVSVFVDGILATLLFTMPCLAQIPCPNNGTIQVCLDWSQQTPPESDLDFAVSFGTNGPNIQLITGDLGWVIYAEIMSSGQPADIASLTLDPATSLENFAITLAHGSAPGAANVSSIDLTASNWAGWSSLAGGGLGPRKSNRARESLARR